ncbi:MAG: hypothetical protein KF760_16665 [Candidatus Eremiobacteraeota bacterium]|nr:hypothetical protein [Candidatus Eremiobacteraeota bacterium]MCW5866480.1 hypothetical protein [Candidatus Eremiobacteraeota bacterium]
MEASTPRQYTIRNIPDDVDAALRQRARDTKKSFNQVALEALMAGVSKDRRPVRDFSDIAGGLSPEEAGKFGFNGGSTRIFGSEDHP